MGGKGKGAKGRRGVQASRARQQQQAAARRNVAAPGGRGGGAADSGAGSPDAPPGHLDGTRSRGRAPAASPPPSPVPAASPPPPVPAASPPSPVPAAGGAAAPLRRYLDVSAVRIQDWLGRTPDLKFRRGASVLLSQATAPDAWEGRLPEGATWNDEAGNVDGVVCLVVADDADIAEVAHAVVKSMREKMPHCPIQAVAGTARSYAAAYPAMALARRDGDFLIDSPPAPAEVILAKPCDQCRAAAATRPGVQVSKDDTYDLCAECEARFDAAGRTAGQPVQAPRPERRLKEALAKAGMPVEDFTDAFADTAAAGQRDRDDAATQLALIYADGNRVGAFISRAAGTPGGPDKATIAPLLDEAALGALAHAVMDRYPGCPRPPVLVNLAGGDDLLVSVPAADAWLFTRTLLASFTSLLVSRTGGWPPQTRQNIPTLSAGLVFHHLKTPFSDVVRLAGERLLLAKKAAGGREAAVAFLDMTADGSQPPPGRQPVTLAYLDKHAERLQQTAGLPNSRRQTLLDLHRNGHIEEFITRLTDFDDNRPLWEIAAGPGATAAAARGELAGNENARHDVRRALDIARHWHAGPRTEAPRTEAEQARAEQDEGAS